MQESPSHKRFLVGCGSPFVLVAKHLTVLRARCKQYLSGRQNPTCLPRHCRYSRVYGHSITAMHGMNTLLARLKRCRVYSMNEASNKHSSKMQIGLQIYWVVPRLRTPKYQKRVSKGTRPPSPLWDVAESVIVDNCLSRYGILGTCLDYDAHVVPQPVSRIVWAQKCPVY